MVITLCVNTTRKVRKAGFGGNRCSTSQYVSFRD